MTHDHDIRAHRFKSLHRIVKRLPFGDARLRHAEVDHIRREPFSGELETRPRPRRVLVKYVEDRLSAERRDLFEWSARDIKKGFSGVEDVFDLFAFEPFDTEEMTVGEIALHHCPEKKRRRAS